MQGWTGDLQWSVGKDGRKGGKRKGEGGGREGKEKGEMGKRGEGGVQ